MKVIFNELEYWKYMKYNRIVNWNRFNTFIKILKIIIYLNIYS